MAIAPRLDLRQTQSLVMTPQLQQAIKLLQLSNMELAAYVEQEIERNPLLDRDEGEDGSRAGDDPGAEPESAAEDANRLEAELFDPIDGRADGTDEAQLDTDFSNVWSDDAAAAPMEWRGNGGRSDFEDAELNLEQTLSRDVSLREHLLTQIGIDLTDPVDRIIATHLLDLLDDSGYLVGDLAQVASVLNCDVARVEATLEKLQRLDPPGVFARNLKECLALQLRDRNRLDPAMAALLDNLDLLARRDIAGLMRVCGVGAEDIADMVAEIKTLNPKPGLAFDRTVLQPIVPDVLMRPAPGGGWIVELNQETLPRVLVNTQYYARISKAARNKAEKDFIVERFNAANWLVKSLHQRAQTILKVATEIVRQQDAFFRHGVRYLRPLVLRDIATAIEMHESTVSRVTTNKYLAAPHGIYELKYFFTSAIASASGGEAHSAEAVRARIRTLIESESPDQVLSDDKLVELLRKDGVDIARRTVAKYREAMRIPSSVQRRREKSLRL